MKHTWGVQFHRASLGWVYLHRYTTRRCLCITTCSPSVSRILRLSCCVVASLRQPGLHTCQQEATRGTMNFLFFFIPNFPQVLHPTSDKSRVNKEGLHHDKTLTRAITHPHWDPPPPQERGGPYKAPTLVNHRVLLSARSLSRLLMN